MQRSRVAPALLSLLLVLPAHAGDSWLSVSEAAPEPARPATPRTPEVPEEGLLGLEPARPYRALRYVHPFAPEALRRFHAAPDAALAPGAVHLVRSPPGPRSPGLNRTLHHQQVGEVRAAGLQVLSPPPRGGVPFTPYLAVARHAPSSPGHALPGWAATRRVEGARVRVSLLGLGDAGADAALEVPLYESGLLEPDAALERSRALLEHLRAEVAPHRTLSRAAVEAHWPEAAHLLGEVPTQGWILAIRTLWKAGDEWIPGPGGVLVRAAVPHAAQARLQRLFAQPDR